MMPLSEAANIVQGSMHGMDARFNSVVTDSRLVASGDLFVAIAGEKFDGHEFLADVERKGAAGALVSSAKESALGQVEVTDTTLALGKLAKNWRSRFGIPTAAITGSNGKTTVTAMAANIFRQAGDCLAPEKSFNNQWGVPMTLLKLKHTHQFAVIEMGTNHVGEIEYLTKLTQPTIALINNIASAHLEGLCNEQQIADAKAEIFLGLSETGTAILNADDRFFDCFKNILGRLRPDCEILSFAIDADATVRAENLQLGNIDSHFELYIGGHRTKNRAEICLPVPGRHNVMNALAASAICFSAGIGLELIRNGLQTTPQVPGRLNVQSGLNGSTIIDDSYNANPESIKAGINVLKEYAGEKILILGAMAELGESSQQLHQEVGVFAKQQGINKLLVLRHGRECDAEFYANGFGQSAILFDDLQVLLDTLKPMLKQDIVVLVKGSRSSRMERVVSAIVSESAVQVGTQMAGKK